MSTGKEDVYEEQLEEEDPRELKKYDRDALYEDKLVENPDFVDEEIDEDEAFAPEDYVAYGDVGKGQKRTRNDSVSDEDASSEEDDESIYKQLSDIVEDESTFSTSNIEKHQGLVQKISQIGIPPKKKAKIEVAESVKEGVFNLQASTKLTMNDLLESIREGKEYNGLRQQMDKLDQKKEKVSVALPTPKVKKDRDLREAQYEETSEVVSEWQPTVMLMHRLPHLSFPLAKPEKPTPTTAQLATNFKPQTDLEKQIADIVEGATVTEDKIKEIEELNARELSVQDLKARNAELAKMRHMMFYKERKLRWHKKIKSRKYRRILRKQKEKYKLTIEELKELDPDAAREEILKQDKVRALERVTLRHKTVGKWAKGAAKSKNPVLQQQLQEAHKLGQDLKKKIQRIDSKSSESDSDEDRDEPSSEEEPETPKKGLLAMKFMQQAQEHQKAEYKQLKEQFNKEEEERIKKLENAAKKLRGEVVTEEAIQVSEKSPEETKSGRISFSGKGKSFKPDTKNCNVTFMGGHHETKDVALGGGFTSKVVAPIVIVKSSYTNSDKNKANNPKNEISENMFEIPEFPQVQIEEQTEQKKDIYHINTLPTEEPKNDKKRKYDSTRETTTKQVKTQQLKQPKKTTEKNLSIDSKIEKQPQKGPTKLANPADNPWMKGDKDDVVDYENKEKKKKDNNELTDEKPSQNKTEENNQNVNQEKKKKLKKLADSQTVNLDLNRLEVRAEQVAKSKDTSTNFNLIASASDGQKELILRAFAHDDVEAEFENEKKKAIDDQLPKEDLDLSLPGWGAWAGTGIEWKPPPKDQRKIKKREEKEKELRKHRKDANLNHVIINETVDTKLEKYKNDRVPQPFISREAYERSLRSPLGKDWNTQTMHRAMTKPRVSTKVGVIIDPITKKIVKKEK